MSEQTRSSSATVDTGSVPTLVPQGPFLGRPDIPLGRSVIAVGSAETSRLRLVSSTVSHAHALIVNTNGHTYIADLASRSGIQVNGQTTPFSYLKSGDRVQIGKFVFRFRVPATQAGEPPPLPPTAPPASIDISGELPIDLGDKPVFTIGRRETNDLPLTHDRGVSTVHAVIFAFDGQWFLRDMHTRSGTHLNGSGIHQHQLDFNDTIQIGTFSLRFQPAAAVPEADDSVSGLDFSAPAVAVAQVPQVEDLPAIEDPFDINLDSPEPELEPLHVDLSSEPPLPAAEELAEIPLEIDEPAIESPQVGEIAELPPAEEPIEIPIELDELAAEPTPVKDIAELTTPEEPAAVPLEIPEPVAELPHIEEIAEEPVEVPLEIPEPAAEVPPVEEITEIPTAEEPIEVPLEISEPTIELPPVEEIAELPTTLEPATIATEIPEPAAELPTAGEPTEVPFDIDQSKAEAPAEPDEFDAALLESLESEIEPAAEEPVAAQASISPPQIHEEPIPAAQELDHTEATAEPEEFDLSILESLEPAAALSTSLPEVHDEPVAAVPESDHAQTTAEQDRFDLSILESATEPPAIAEPAVTSAFASAPQVHEDPIAAVPEFDRTEPSAEQDGFDLSILESLEPAPTADEPEVALSTPTAFEPSSDAPQETVPPTDIIATTTVINIEPPFPPDVVDLIYSDAPVPPTPAAAEIIPPAKPKRKRAPRKKKAVAKPAVEILEPTEPTFESALGPSAAADTPAAAAAAEMLSDTTFGRAVEEFSGSSTGPIIDQPTELPPVEVVSNEIESAATPPPMQLSQIPDGEEFVAIPELEELPAAELPVADLLHESPLTELPDEMPIADLPVAEPLPEEPPHTFTYSSMLESEQAVSDATISQDEPPLIEELPESPAVETSAASTVSEPQPAAAPPAPPAPARPSIFGFQFDGGSFLGGMPLRLPKLPEQTTLAAPAANAPFKFTTYSPLSQPITMPIKGPPAQPVADPPVADPPVAEPPVAELPVAEAPAEYAHVEDLPLADLSTIESSFEELTPEDLMAPEPSVSDLSPPPAPPVAETPPTPTAPPPTAPRSPTPLPRPQRLADSMSVPPLAKSVVTAPPPRRPLTTAFDGLAGRGLVGGLVGGPPQPAADVFGTPSAARGATRRADVFSQIAAPISVEVFGAVQGNAKDFVIPDVRKPLMPSPPRPSPPAPVHPSSSNEEPPPTEQDFQDAAVPTEPLEELLESSEPQPAIPMPTDVDLPPAPSASSPPARRLRVPVLLTMMILLLAATWAGVYYFLPPASRVTGTLAFAKLTDQPMSVQLVFQQQQIARLHSEEVRSVARSMLTAQNQDPGFLDDAMLFEQATTKTGNAGFVDNGEKLQLTTKASDAVLGKARVDALLLSLKQKDADLVDAQARAQRAYDDAQAAVNQVNVHLDDLNAQRTAEQARGESRPDPEEIAALTTESERLDKIWNLAKADLAETQTALADLQSIPADRPPTVDTDPQLTRLHHQSSDLDQQISALQAIADAGHSTLDQDNQLQDLKAQSDDLAARIKDRLLEIAADAKLTPQQRQAGREKQIQALSDKLADQQTSESSAAAAAKTANDKLADVNKKLAQARTASTDDLISQITAARADLNTKKDDAIEKNHLLAQSISLAGDPQVSVQALPDQRPLFAGGASVVILVIFSLMIVSASRNTAIPIADRPAPHPQPHPNAGNEEADEPSPASL